MTKYLINAPTRQVARAFVSKAKEQGIRNLSQPFKTEFGYWTVTTNQPVLSLNR
jgi:hypothetical protein